MTAPVMFRGHASNPFPVIDWDGMPWGKPEPVVKHRTFSDLMFWATMEAGFVALLVVAGLLAAIRLFGEPV